MRPIRNGSPSAKEMWGEAEIMNHLKCDKEMAKRILGDYHSDNGGYGKVEKAIMLDYIENWQRHEREREARYKSDLANVETATALKEQVKVLREQVRTLNEQTTAMREQIVVLRESSASSGKDAQKARIASYISNAIAVASLIVSVISILLKAA